MTREELILACLGSSHQAFTPVRIQKALFILDRKGANLTGGPHFHFVPFDYGPFDSNVYFTLHALNQSGEVDIIGDRISKSRAYGLTDAGREKANAILDQSDVRLKNYLKNVADFVTSLSFAELVSAIYREFPEMKANSVFAKAP